MSNPLFVGDSKLSNHSFIRHVKAESLAQPKTPFGEGSASKRFFKAKDGSSNTSDGHNNTYKAPKLPELSMNKFISLRKLSQDSDENQPSFLKTQTA